MTELQGTISAGGTESHGNAAEGRSIEQELENEARKNDDPRASSLIDYRLALVKDAINLRHSYEME
jgi:hypothetical protein